MPRGLFRQVPTTAAGAEVVLLIAFVGLRGLDLGQAVVALPGGLDRSPRPVIDLVALAMLAAESLVLTTVVLRKGRYADARWAWLDVTTGIAVLLSTMTFTLPADRFTSWADWGYPVTLSVALGIGIGFEKWRDVCLATGGLTAAYLVTTVGAFDTATDRSTAVTNALSYWTFAVLTRLMAGYLRRMAASADQARATASRLAAEAERERHRLLLHDQAAVLGMVANGVTDDHLLEVARHQAAAGQARIRAFLADEVRTSGNLSVELAAVAGEFTDLPLTINIDLARVEVAPDVCRVLAEAVRTLLHNVRRHAQASSVVLHAQTTTTRWEVTVSDDGTGFDPCTTPFGYGLSQQVIAAVDGIGGVATVRTASGEGTTVGLTGPNHQS